MKNISHYATYTNGQADTRLFFNCGICIPYKAKEDSFNFFSALKKLHQKHVFNAKFLKIYTRVAWIGSEQHKQKGTYSAEISFDSLARQLDIDVSSVKRASLLAQQLGFWILKSRPHYTSKIMNTRAVFDLARMAAQGRNPRKSPPKTIFQVLSKPQRLHIEQSLARYGINVIICHSLLKKTKDIRFLEKTLAYLAQMPLYLRNRIQSMTAYFCKCFLLIKNQKFNWNAWNTWKKSHLSESIERRKKMDSLLEREKKRRADEETKANRPYLIKKRLLEQEPDKIQAHVEDIMTHPEKRANVLIEIAKQFFNAQSQAEAMERIHLMGFDSDKRLRKWVQDWVIERYFSGNQSDELS